MCNRNKLISMIMAIMLVIGVLPIHGFAEYAQFTEGCLVTFNPQDGNDFYNVTVSVGGKITDKPADPEREGYVFKGWYSYLDEDYLPVFWDFEIDTVNHNMTLWAAWEEVQEETCIVFFDPNGGIPIAIYYEVPVGGRIIDRPADSEREGYIFKGWYSYLDENNLPVFWDFETDTVNHDMTLFAAWEEVQEETCTVFFDPNDGINIEIYDVTVPVGGKITDKPADPKREGYIFKGWVSSFSEDNQIYWNFETDTVNHNMFLWAVWEEVQEETCMVFFDPNGGLPIDIYEATVPAGGKITDKPADPKREGYIFKGWVSSFSEDNQIYWNFETDTVNHNMFLWAYWEIINPGEEYLVIFDLGDGTNTEVYDVTVCAGGKITDIPENPVREGYIFKGWLSSFSEDNQIYWNFDEDIVTGNMTLWAAWGEEACPVVFSLDRYSYEKYYETYVPFGEKITDIPENPVREGYRFKGWYIDWDENNAPIWWDFETDTIESGIAILILWADWEEAYTVTFYPNDGTNVSIYEVMVPIGGKITDIPENPVREGYIFKGWYSRLDENDKPDLWDFETDTVEANMSLWAAWEVEEKDKDYGSVGKKSSVDKINIGSSHTYTITVSQSKYADSIWANVKAKDILTEVLDYVSYKSEDGVVVTANGRELSIDFGDIGVGESKTVIITVKVNNNGKIGETIENKVMTNNNKIAIDPNGPIITKKTTGGGSSGGGSSSGGSSNDKEELIIDEEIPLGLLKGDHIAYIQGYPDGYFRPENPITRAEAAQIFYNLLVGDKKTGYTSKFPDVRSGLWYSDAINYLSSNNIIQGYPDGNFRPNEYITRAEFATITSNFDELSLTSKNQFEDVQSNHWAIKYINSAAIKGWVKGYENGEFRPDNNITRAEAVTLINSIFERKISLEDIPKEARTYIDITSSHWAYCDIIEASNSHSYERKEDGLLEIWNKVIK